MPADDAILDPAHDDSQEGLENVGAAGIPKPEAKPDGQTDDKVSGDGNILERDGVKYVRAEALHNERQQRQQLQQQIALLDPLIPEFNEFLAQKNGRQQATVDRARQSAAADSDYSTDELEGFAITRGYYKDDGTTPDTSRAQRELDIISGISRRQARKEVAPVAETTTRDRARINRERARGQQFVDGQPIADDRYVQAAFNALPDDYVADPQVAQITSLVAAGLEYLDRRKNGTLGNGRPPRRASGEPMHVEQGTGRYDGDQGELSELDIAAARARGKTPEQWAKLQKAANRSVNFEDA